MSEDNVKNASSTQTDVTHFIDEVGAGVLKAQLGTILSEISLNQIVHGSKGKKSKISVEFTFEQLGDNNQVMISHKLHYKKLTKRGEQTETTSSDSSFFVGRGGKLTIDQPKEENGGQFSLVQMTEARTRKVSLD